MNWIHDVFCHLKIILLNDYVLLKGKKVTLWLLFLTFHDRSSRTMYQCGPLRDFVMKGWDGSRWFFHQLHYEICIRSVTGHRYAPFIKSKYSLLFIERLSYSDWDLSARRLLIVMHKHLTFVVFSWYLVCCCVSYLLFNVYGLWITSTIPLI